MAGLSEITPPGNETDRLSHPPFFKDHHVGGRPVLPAVEAMEALAAALDRTTGVQSTDITDAVFDKFLYLDAGKASTVARCRFSRLADGTVQAALLTKTRSPKAAITRTKTHARMIFGPPARPEPVLPLDLAAAPEGICREVSPDRLYADLVPFGPAYRNIGDAIYLASDGAIARVGSPRPMDTRRDLILGAPYPLDAACHAACAWSQHFRDIVAFPVAVAHRKIVRTTRLDGAYVARIIPRTPQDETLVFDIFLFDHRGNLYETAAGVQMRDISGGRTRPPEWIRKKESADRLAPIRMDGLHLAVIERRCVAPFADQTLSPRETRRHAPMAGNRQRSFVAARLALKRLSRKLGGDNRSVPPGEIDTVRDNSPKPVCPVAGRSKQVPCSVSHDSRFAVAVAAAAPVGIDVEQIDGKALKNRQLFANAAEIGLIKHFPNGEQEAAVRVWSAKEAAAKALDLPLAKAWDRVRVSALESDTSRLEVAETGTCRVRHAVVDDHLFTLLIQE